MLPPPARRVADRPPVQHAGPLELGSVDGIVQVVGHPLRGCARAVVPNVTLVQLVRTQPVARAGSHDALVAVAGREAIAEMAAARR